MPLKSQLHVNRPLSNVSLKYKSAELIWDKVLGLGSTDALAGFASTTANLVVAFYFGKRGIENLAMILKRK